MGVTVDIRRIVVGSALAAGVGVAGMIGAGTASAAPGISYDGGPEAQEEDGQARDDHPYRRPLRPTNQSHR